MAVIVTLISIALLVSSTFAVVPSYIKICGRYDPNINKCVEDSVMQLLPKLKEGIPELDAPRMEPLFVDEIVLADLDEFHAVAKNVMLHGLANPIIKYLKIDLEKQKVDLDLLFPQVNLDSEYDVKAKIIVSINEKGPINIVTDNVTAKATLVFKTVDQRGRKLIYFPTMTAKIVVKSYKATYKAASKNNPLGMAINAVLGSNSQEIIRSMTPNLEKAISEKVLDMANRICKHFTYDELFPDRM